MLHHAQMQSFISDPPEVFLLLARQYHLPPERLAKAIIWTFCLAPPRELILVAREAPSDRVLFGAQ